MALTQVTSPAMLDATGRLIADSIERQNLILTRMITTEGTAASAAELREIHAIVQSGEAPAVLSIGDQINVNYNDGTNDYVLPFDIVHHGSVTLQDGEVVPGMFIQSHYAMESMQFDAKEAFYNTGDTGLAAGTYNFTVTGTSGAAVPGTYQFTSEAVAPNARLVFATSIYDNGINGASINVYNNPTDAQPSQTMSVSTGSEGTNLGTISLAGGDGMNALQRAALGNNRWSQSALRQRLNSGAAAGAWWSPQNPFDMPPSQLAALPGFKAGFDEVFLDILKPVQINTALNTVSDGGGVEATYDMFFPASLQQEYIAPQLADTEGEYWEYWKRRLGLDKYQATGMAGTNAAHIRYAYNAKTSAQNGRLRSAYRGSASGVWYVSASGAASGYGVAYSYRSAPACVIC